ncbi:unnamed protein product [Vitrella brassicaformis CCMP3155]|uniref:Uncharacterized protein n=1 Tax=Vitrella brassicaformis (strain CCMP3155) TaxID=1169540 RepID=A0A0G4EVC5_VITBC|nr:unnamed protein product [Vitrella brassicaformis CCMP3155]|eukprot:CEM02014.1 unnamed protein product [Vitrella brassicaformis CCMP3155]
MGRDSFLSAQRLPSWHQQKRTMLDVVSLIDIGLVVYCILGILDYVQDFCARVWYLIQVGEYEWRCAPSVSH